MVSWGGVQKFPAKKGADLEFLVRLHTVGVGAEPIHPEGCRQFTELFHERCGLPLDAATAANLRSLGLGAPGILEALLARLDGDKLDLVDRHPGSTIQSAVPGQMAAVDSEPAIWSPGSVALSALSEAI